MACRVLCACNTESSASIDIPTLLPVISSCYVAPSPVLNLTVTSVQERSCLLTWAAPQWMNGDFEYYSIRLYGDVIHHTINASSTDTHYSCKELEEGTHYSVAVVAVSKHGVGKVSYTDFTTSFSRKCSLLISFNAVDVY